MDNENKERARMLCSGRFALIFIIALSAQAVFNYVYQIQTVTESTKAVDTWTAVAEMILGVITLMIAVSCWMIYSTAKNDIRIDPKGFTFLRDSLTVKMFSGFVVLALLIVSVAGDFYNWIYPADQRVGTADEKAAQYYASIILMVLIAAACGVMIWLFIRGTREIAKSVEDVLNGREENLLSPGYITVFIAISIFFTAIDLFGITGSWHAQWTAVVNVVLSIVVEFMAVIICIRLKPSRRKKKA